MRTPHRSQRSLLDGLMPTQNDYMNIEIKPIRRSPALALSALFGSAVPVYTRSASTGLRVLTIFTWHTADT